MNATIKKDVARIEGHLSRIAGIQVELTVRGLRSFTFSAEGNVESSLRKLENFLGEAVETRFDYDLECDHSCLYVEVKEA